MDEAGTAVFDIIGTCFSLERPRRALTSLGAPPGLLDTWFAQSLRDYFALSHAGGYAPLKEVLQAELPRTLGRGGVRHSGDDLRTVMAAFGELDPRPDLADAVDHLRARGWQLKALTNGSDVSTRALLERAGVLESFAAVLSCDSIQVSKPNPAAYRLAAGGDDAAGLWMIAAHAWDIAGAARFGMRTAYVDSVEGAYLAPYPKPDVTAGTLIEAVRQIAP